MDFLGFYNWSVIIEQVQFNIISFSKNILAYYKYLPIQNKQKFPYVKWRKLYQFGFRHRIRTCLKRTRRYIYKHFYLLKRPFRRFRRLNGFRYFQPRRRRGVWLSWPERCRKRRLYYKLKRSPKVRRLFGRFKKHTGIQCPFNIWFRKFTRSKFMKIFRVHMRKPKHWYLTVRQFEKCLASLPFFPRFKSILLRPFSFTHWVDRRCSKNEIYPTPYLLYSRFQTRAFIRQKNLKLKVFNN